MRKPRKRLPRMSEKRKVESRTYARRKAKFLKEHTHCFACKQPIHPQYRDLHHWRGRAGKLFLDERHWKMACRSCHTMIHENRKYAVATGLLAGPKEWNVCPP